MRLLLALITAMLIVTGTTACGQSTLRITSASSPVTNTTPTASTATGSSTRPSRPPQTDDYISTYGHEATEPDKRKLTRLINRYYAAAVADDGAKACSMIYSTLAEAVPEDYGKPPGPAYMRGNTCAAVLTKMFKHLPGQTTADLATTKVTGVRLMGRHGFVQFTSRTIPTGEIHVEHEGKAWKLGVVIGETCDNCSANAATP